MYFLNTIPSPTVSHSICNKQYILNMMFNLGHGPGWINSSYKRVGMVQIHNVPLIL